MSRFFLYLSNLPDQDYFAALGSGQRVKVKDKFTKRAKIAYELSLKAIEESDLPKQCDKWKKVFGSPFPSRTTLQKSEAVAALEAAAVLAQHVIPNNTLNSNARSMSATP